MKRVLMKRTLRAALLAGAVITTGVQALDIPGLEKTTGQMYALADIANNNVDVLQHFSGASLGKQLPAGIGRKQVLVVEPVLTGATPDAAASGAALATAIQTANAKPYPIVLYVDAGQYTIASSSIALNKNVTLQGAGRNATVIKVNAITSAAPAISQLTLKTSLLTQTQSGSIHEITVDGAVLLDGGSIVFAMNHIFASSKVALTIGNVHAFSINSNAIDSPTVAIMIKTPVDGNIIKNDLQGHTPIQMTGNGHVLIANNIYYGGTPQFYGDYKTSEQRCHNNIDATTGLPVPNYASGVSPLCVAPTTGEVAK